MKFNFIVWTALCYAACKANTPLLEAEFLNALKEYAADCGGTMRVKTGPYSGYPWEFIKPAKEQKRSA